MYRPTVARLRDKFTGIMVLFGCSRLSNCFNTQRFWDNKPFNSCSTITFTSLFTSW